MKASTCREKIIDYYNCCWTDAEFGWGLDTYHSIHYGYYDRYHCSHGLAVENFNRVISHKAKIKRDDRVLDAGCGVGGSSVWLGQERGCAVVGINVIPAQLTRARNLAELRGVTDLVTFELCDYNSTGLPDESFTVVWGLESICHSEDKREFCREAWRLLKPGGRIIVADGFLAREAVGQTERRYLQEWYDGWAVPHLSRIDEFRTYLSSAGFAELTFNDVTGNILPSARRMFWGSIAAYGVAKPATLLGLMSTVRMGHMSAAYYQYLAIRRRLWKYGVFTGVKR